MCIVVCDSNGGQVGEQSNEDDEVGADGFVDDNHRRNKVNLQVQAQGDPVLDVSFHALENLACRLDGEHNGGETRSQEHDVGGRLSSLGGTLDSNTAIRLLQRRSIIDTCVLLVQ